MPTARTPLKTRLDNGVSITVNFGGKPFPLPGGETVAAMGFRAQGQAR
jgi:hypothetical protein